MNKKKLKKLRQNSENKWINKNLLKVNPLENIKRKFSEINDILKREKMNELQISKDGIYCMFPPFPKQITDPDPNIEETILKNIPPYDWFFRAENYFAANFEEIRKATNDLYSEKPYIDQAICVYFSSSDQSKTETYKNLHQKAFKYSNAITVKNGSFHLLGDFKENRKKTKIGGNETQLINDIMANLEADQETAKALLEKRKRDLKLKNDNKYGKDSNEAKKMLAYREGAQFEEENKKLPDGYVERVRKMNQEHASNPEIANLPVVESALLTVNHKTNTIEKEVIYLESDEKVVTPMAKF